MQRRRAILGIATAASLAALFCARPLRAVAQGPEAEDDALAQRIDAATDRALEFLARRQQADGSWKTGSSYGVNAAVCSLAILAFLAKGDTPGDGPYGEKITKGIEFIIGCQKPNGLICATPSQGPMYSHCISTLMLAESVGMLTAPLQARARRALARAVRLILQAQAVRKGGPHQGGWRYESNSSDSDISVTGWALMSLRAAKNAGAQVPDEAFRQGVEYIRRLAVPGGGFGYQAPGDPAVSRTGTGILALEICGRHDTVEARRGGDFLLKHRLQPDGQDIFFSYSVYYCSQAMFQLGDKYWMAYKPQVAQVLLGRQLADGSWKPVAQHDVNGGPPYVTAMAVLALSIEYRYLPIYQR